MGHVWHMGPANTKPKILVCISFSTRIFDYKSLILYNFIIPMYHNETTSIKRAIDHVELTHPRLLFDKIDSHHDKHFHTTFNDPLITVINKWLWNKRWQRAFQVYIYMSWSNFYPLFYLLLITFFFQSRHWFERKDLRVSKHNARLKTRVNIKVIEPFSATHVCTDAHFQFSVEKCTVNYKCELHHQYISWGKSPEGTV